MLSCIIQVRFSSSHFLGLVIGNISRDSDPEAPVQQLLPEIGGSGETGLGIF